MDFLHQTAGFFETLLFLAAVGGGMVLHYKASTSRLQAWAARDGYEILEWKPCYFFTGPYFFRTSKGQQVYRVLVRDRAGRLRRGYVRCGGWFLGIFSDHVDARWDDAGRSG